MRCTNPLLTLPNTPPCGQCLNCRIDKKRKISTRIQLETLYHAKSTFVTLTYRDEDLPITGQVDLEGDSTDLPIPTVRRDHYDEFIKTLRNALRAFDSTYRYFGCAEYGDEGESQDGMGRPHYHFIIFGMDASEEQWLEDEIWEKGFVECGDVTPERASYVAGYTVKKLNGDHKDLRGREPEFSTRSTSGQWGAIGQCAVPWLAAAMSTQAGKKQLMQNGDVFTTVRINGKVWPLDRLMRRKIRAHLGIPDNQRDRAILFDLIDHQTGEILNPPLPADYSPRQDATAISTPFRREHEKKEIIEILPQIRQDAEKAQRSLRRKKAESRNTI